MNLEPAKAVKMPLLAGLNDTTEELSVTEDASKLDEIAPNKPLSAWDLQLQKIGPYQIVKVLGFGGVGTVFEAYDTTINRGVALKVLNRKWLNDKVAKERFLREARLCALVKSPHVAMIHAVGEEEGVPYLAMELLSGISLQQLMYKVKLTIPQIIRLARETAKGLSAAHAHHLIHRDIKPANIWLETLSDPAGSDKKMYRVKILDFGLARLLEQNDGLTRQGFVVGTPLYMSPEQARGSKIDARSDLYSMGVVLYQLCTGNLPLQGKDVAEVLTAIADETPTPAREVNPDVPDKLSRLIERLMNKAPDKRPPDAINLVRLLEIIENEEERLAIKKLPEASSNTEKRPSSSPLASSVNNDSQSLLKIMLIVSFAMNVVIMCIISVLIYVLLTRH